MGTIHSEAKRTIATMGRSEAGGMRKQPKKTAQVKKNIEVAVGRNPIARLFGRRKPKN